MFKLLRNLLILEAIIAFLAMSLEAATTTDFSNTIKTSLTSSNMPAASVCCFVIQETVNDIFAEIYSTRTYYEMVNKTAITARVTPYPNTTLSNFETNIYPTNATLSVTVPVGLNVLANFARNAPGPTLTATKYNESITVVAGQTINSPQAAYVYTTVKVITAAPVTDTNGNIVCATPWSFPTDNILFWNGNSTTLGGSGPETTPAEIFPSINSNAQAYWGSDIAGLSSITTDNYVSTATYTYGSTPITYSDSTYTPETVTGTQTGILTSTFWINSKFESVDTDAAKQTGVTITLDEPFVYQPKTAALGSTGAGSVPCRSSSGTEGWGYPPQTLIQYMAQKPAISSQYPGLEHCIPAGPSMIEATSCVDSGGETLDSGGDLTETTTLTIMPDLSLTAAVPTTEIAAGAPVVSSQMPPSTTIVATSSSIETPIESTSPPAIIHSTDVPPADSFTSNIGSPPVESPPAEPSPPESPSSESPPNSPPSNNNPPVTTSTSDPPSPISVPAATPIQTLQGGDAPSPSINKPSTPPGDGIASAIASIIGANPVQAPTIISGTTEVVVWGQATMPYNPSISISGNTIKEGGVTQVVVSSATTVLLSQVLESLPGSTALVSGNLEVILGPSTIPVNSKLPELSGSTTIIAGTPYVVVTAQTTVPVVLGIPTGLAGGNSNETTPLQVSGGDRSFVHVRIEGLLILMSLVAMPFI